MIECVKSLFYKVTFLPPVKLTQDRLKKMHASDEKIKKFIADQFNVAYLKKVYSTPLSLNPNMFNKITKLVALNSHYLSSEWTAKNQVSIRIQSGGYVFPFDYSSLVHKLLPGKIVKHASKKNQMVCPVEECRFFVQETS